MTKTNFLSRWFTSIPFALALALIFSVQPASAQSDTKKADDPKKDEHPTIRIRAGASKPFKDSKGNKWLPDDGFDGGDTIERPELEIENTPDPDIYRAEHYSMDTFSQKIPNGKYIVKLHFCETYDGIGGPGDRVFTYKIQDKEFKNFDVWKKVGKAQKAYVETVNVDVADGKLKITFTPIVQNPQINGIEIIPFEKATAEEKAAAEAKPKADK